MYDDGAGETHKFIGLSSLDRGEEARGGDVLVTVS